MKTQGMSQQLEALRRMNGRKGYALFMEQGTGKSWTLLADAERLFHAGTIDAMFVVAPKGVHTNWVLREIPAHLEVPHIAMAWTSGMGKRARERMEKLLEPRQDGAPQKLRILAMNYEAVPTKDGFAFAARFLRCTNALFALDESGRIKNPNAVRTKKIMALRPLSEIRRIATGTPVTQSPLDAFSQMEFLEHGLLGTTSHRAFVAEFAEVLPQTHPLVIKLVERNPKAALAQIVAKNPDGSPRYRNLDKLRSLLERHSYRVLKKDCLDLPEKVFTQVFFELTPKQRAAYETLEDDLRIQLDNGQIEVVSALAALVKLQQVSSGYVNVQGGVMKISDGDNPRLEALLEVVEDCPGKFIVWARFREEMRQIAEALRKAGIETVEYHGGVGKEDREAAVDGFQTGSARAFVGNPQAGGIGLTLTAAEDVIYYSNSFKLEDRLQSEDRAHRIGTKHTVRYTDIVAINTIDEPISKALQRKTSVAAAILGDRGLRFPL